MLRLRQRSPWNGFDHEFLSASGDVVGSLRAPMHSQAKNARLAFHPRGSTAGDTPLALHGKTYFVRHEYLRRGFTNDVRYTLETAAGEVLCRADVTFEPQRRLPALRLTHPLAAEVMPSTSFWRKRFPILGASGGAIGEISEPKAFTLRMEYGIRLPEASPPLLAFLLAVTLFVRR